MKVCISFLSVLGLICLVSSASIGNVEFKSAKTINENESTTKENVTTEERSPAKKTLNTRVEVRVFNQGNTNIRSNDENGTTEERSPVNKRIHENVGEVGEFNQANTNIRSNDENGTTEERSLAKKIINESVGDVGVFNQGNTNIRSNDERNIEEVPKKLFLKSYNGLKSYNQFNHPNKGDGLYSFYFHIGDSEREEEGQAAGQVVGKYAYVAPEGQEFQFKYGAGYDGYRVESPALPQVPEDTPEVKKAKEEFFAAYEKILKEVGDYDYQYNQIDEKDYVSNSIDEKDYVTKNIDVNDYASKRNKYEDSSSEESSEESYESKEHAKRALGYYNQHLGIRFNPYG